MEDLTDMDLTHLLKSWNLAHLYNIFRDHHINLDVLKLMKHHHICNLFINLPIGDHVIFESKLEEWKSKLQISDNMMLNTPLNNETLETQPKFSKHQNCSVMQMLEESNSGKSLLKYFTKNKIFHEEQRNIIVNTIAKYIIDKDFVCSVSDCSEIEKEICSIFPTEKLEFYCTGKRGKIYNKVSNLKRLHKGIFGEKCISTENETTTFSTEEGVTFAIECLRSQKITNEEFDIYWRKCAPCRFAQISETESTAEILKLWPEYSKPSGFQLIQIDFTLKYPMAKDMKLKWSHLENKLIHLIKTKLSCVYLLKTLNQIEQSNTESKIFGIFWFLHHLFPPHQKAVSDQLGSKLRKKFSVADSQESFAIIADTTDELDTKLKLLKLQGRNIQPRLLIVGELTKIETINIFFDNLKYPFLTMLNAIDALFKTFFVFNLKYPEESDIFYNFLQTLFYEIPLNKKISTVSIMKNEVLNLDI